MAKPRVRRIDLTYHPGYIAKGLNPVGEYAQKGLSPVGYGVEKGVKPVTDLVGGITRPVLGAVAGTKEEKAEVLGGDKKAEDFKRKPILTKESGEEDDQIGGKDQTAENPLGL